MSVERSKLHQLLDDFRGLSRLWPFVKQDRSLLLLIVAMIPIISLTQTIGPIIIKAAVDHGVVASNLEELTYYAALFLAVVLVEYAARMAQSLATSYSIFRMILNLRNHLVEHITKLSPSFHDKNLSGALTTRATSDFEQVTISLSQGVLQSTVDIFVLGGCFIGMFILDWRLCVFAILLLPAIIAIVSWFSFTIKKHTLAARKYLSEANAYAHEALTGITQVKSFTIEERVVHEFTERSEKFRESQMLSVSYDAFLYSILEGLSSIVVGFSLWAILSRFLDLSMLSAGLIIAYVRYLQQMFEPLKQLGANIGQLQGVFAAIERIFNLLATPLPESRSGTLAEWNGEVTFRNVTFCYDRAKQPALDGVSFHIQPGTAVALVGRTGSGKSSITKLLLQLYGGYRGDVLLGNRPLVELNTAWVRENIAFVPQEISLFRGDIAFNIGLNHPHANLDKIRQAAEIVGADAFIQNLPGGYSYPLQEGGLNLSQGQRQLLIFARALVHQPPFVILDEATSSIDLATERLIQAATQKILKGRSALIIAHRLETIKNCDKILVLSHGQIIEHGTHEELLQHGGNYAKLSREALLEGS